MSNNGQIRAKKVKKWPKGSNIAKMVKNALKKVHSGLKSSRKVENG